MPSNDYPVHQSFTRPIPELEGGGWEFWCKDCSYRVRYTQNGASIGPLVHILDAGDPTIRHTSNPIVIVQGLEEGIEELDSSLPADTPDQPPADDRIIRLEDITGETWVTPEISAFLKNILAGLD